MSSLCRWRPEAGKRGRFQPCGRDVPQLRAARSSSQHKVNLWDENNTRMTPYELSGHREGECSLTVKAADGSGFEKKFIVRVVDREHAIFVGTFKSDVLNGDLEFRLQRERCGKVGIECVCGSDVGFSGSLGGRHYAGRAVDSCGSDIIADVTVALSDNGTAASNYIATMYKVNLWDENNTRMTPLSPICPL